MNRIRRHICSLSAFLTIAALGGAATPTFAYERITRSSASHDEADGRLVDVQVLVDGSAVPLYFKPGSWSRHYFEALKGRNYSIVVRNQTGRRVGVLIAVDGLNVVNGEKTRRAHDEPMYVLGPYERAVIRGWRTSLDDIRRFVFVDEHRSYAERTGQSNSDMGWIRVLSFREQEPWPRVRYRDDSDRQDLNEREGKAGRDAADAPPPSAAREETRAQVQKDQVGQNNGPTESNPGTGWGEHRRDRVREVEFLAAIRATDHLVLRYEYEAGLRSLGIYPRHHRTWERERGELGFAQPPRW